MSKTRRNHSPQFKANVAVEVLQSEKTSTRSPTSIKYHVHPTQVTQWRRQLTEQATEVFAGIRPAPKTPPPTASSGPNATSLWPW